MRTHPDAVPPACPYRSCRFHRAPPPEFFRPLGFYRTRGYPGGIRRYRCTACRRSFSIRRFSVEFRLHKPQQTPWVIHQLVSCVSLRQSARLKKLGREAIERRLDRFGNHSLRLLGRVARVCAPIGGRFLLDEAESFEGSRRAKPITIPILIHGKSRFIVAFGVGTLPPRRRSLQREGMPPRVSQSNKVVRQCLRRLLRIAQPGSLLATDRKPSYRRILRALDPNRTIRHETVSSKAPRGKRSHLFDMNHTLAMTRDGLSRLRRQTWCHAKKAMRVLKHLAVYALWRNFHRPRFNRDLTVTPAQFANVVDHRFTMKELVRWRVDLGAATICPLRARHGK
jgi:transposase-like protein